MELLDQPIKWCDTNL